MNSKYEHWANDPERQRKILIDSLSEASEEDLLVDYIHVALAFPSKTPSPNSFDYPLIDSDLLKNWGSKNGWQINTAPEKTPSGSPHPFIRFTKSA